MMAVPDNAPVGREGPPALVGREGPPAIVRQEGPPATVGREGPPALGRWDLAMKLALEQARSAARHGDVPVGAVVLDPLGEVVSMAGNTREQHQDPTGHAELNAIRAAARTLDDWRLIDHTLVVTLEPCTMCAGAIVLSRLARLVFGAYDPKAGAVASLFDVVRDPRLNHYVDVRSGIAEAECGELLRDFFAGR